MKHSGKSINPFIFYIRILHTSAPNKYLLYLPEKVDWFPSLCNNLKDCMKYNFLGWRLMRTFYRKTYIKISWKTLVNRECLIDINVGPLPRRSAEDWSGLSVWTVCLIVPCLSVCLSANFLIFLLLTSSFIVLSPLLFIYKIIAVMI